jgi:hypothetical protein
MARKIQWLSLITVVILSTIGYLRASFTLHRFRVAGIELVFVNSSMRAAVRLLQDAEVG